MGKYDVPAIIDYILNNTKQEKLHYIGHSQGGTSLYIAMSLRPEYNNKVRLAILLAPGGLMRRLPHLIYNKAARFVNNFQVRSL